MNLNCTILCAAGFAEESLQQTLPFLQAREIKPIILGLKIGIIKGDNGGEQATEALISHYIGDDAKRPLPDGLLIAGGLACGNHLLVDPRVHLLVAQMNAQALPVGFLFPVLTTLYRMLGKNSAAKPFAIQERHNLEAFFHTFTYCLQHKTDSSAVLKSSTWRSKLMAGNHTNDQTKATEIIEH